MRWKAGRETSVPPKNLLGVIPIGFLKVNEEEL